MKKSLFDRSKDGIPHSSDEEAEEGEEQETNGLFELWPAMPEGEVQKLKTTIDIVAIHGLGGHPYKTWTEGSRLWLRDFLPTHLPEARILTFGYNAGIAFTGSASKLKDFALQLLNALKSLRRKTKEPKRKTIFICHSLGGIVFKKAMIIAHERESLFGEIEKSIESVIFMATPHGGAHIAYWSKMLGSLSNIPLRGSIRTDLLDDLELKSEILGDICSQFIERGTRLRICSLYERLKMKGLNDLVVDERSAVMNLPNERPIPVEADHQSICRYLSANSQRYLQVQALVQDLVEDSMSDGAALYRSPDDEKFLKRLQTLDHSSVRQRVPSRFGTSCQWIMGQPTYNLWRDSLQNRLIWLHGSAGSGKTVMTNYIISRLQGLENGPTGNPNVPSVRHCVAYFFCDDKVPGRNTSQDLLRSLLYQVLFATENARLFKLLDANILKSDAREITDSEELWDCLLRICHQSQGIFFWFVVDAIDELKPVADNDVRRGIERLIGGDIMGRVRVFISGRSIPGSESRFGLVLNPLSIDMDNADAQADVKKFIRAEIATLCEKVVVTRTFQQALEDKIFQQSNKTFLQASLAWASFAKGAENWTPAEARQKLNDLNSKTLSLESSYCELLRRIPARFQMKVKRALEWVLTCSGQLTITELHAAITLQGHYKNYTDLLRDLDKDFVREFNEHCRYLFNVEKDGLVYVAHQSVKDMLVQERGSDENEPILRIFRVSIPEAHLMIARNCFVLMQFTEFSRTKAETSLAPVEKFLGPNFPFRISDGKATYRDLLSAFTLFGYSLRHWAWHCSQIEEFKVADALYKHIKSWSGEYCRLAASPLVENTYQIAPDNFFPETHRNVPTLHHLMQRGDFPEVTQLLLESGQDVNQVDDAGATPLCWAIIRDRPKSFNILMKWKPLDPSRGVYHINKPTQYCIIWQRISYLERLLNHSRVDVNEAGYLGQTPLHLALSLGQTVTVDMLLAAKDIDVLARDGAGATPLEVAFRKGHGQLAVKKMINMVDIKYVPKISAGFWGWSDIEEEIIEKDPSRVLEIEGDGMSALTRYAYNGRREKVEMILRKLKPEALTTSMYWGRYNLVQLCAHQDWEKVVQTLIEKFGLDGLDGDHVGRTLLHWAVEYGWKYALVDHWNKPKSWLNRQDRDGLTALHLAVTFRNIQAIQSLVEQGANMLLPDKHGKNAVHLAAETGFRAALKVFIREKAREFGRDNSGASLLHFLVMWQEPNVIKHFIERKKIRVNVRDRNRRTPLHFACMHCNLGAAKTLLLHKADIRMKDCYGQTALHIALREGQLKMVQILMDHGADIRESDGFKQNCLQMAIRGQDPATIQYILNRAPFVQDRDKLGRTALHRACEMDDPDLIRRLIDLDANINAKDNFSHTPLHLAVIKSNANTISVLLEQDQLKVSSMDHLNCTPLDRALAHENSHIIDMLKARGAKSTSGHLWKQRAYVALKDKASTYVWPNWPLMVVGVDERREKLRGGGDLLTRPTPEHTYPASTRSPPPVIHQDGMAYRQRSPLRLYLLPTTMR